MKKNMKAFLSLLLVLVFTLQFAGMTAIAEPAVNVNGTEALVYALYLPNSDPEATGNDKLIPVTAENEEELLGGKHCSIVLQHDDSSAEDGKHSVDLPRTPGTAALRDLLTEDLVITPPEGFLVSQLYLRGDAVESQPIKALPFQADAEKTTVILKAGAVAAYDKDNSKDIVDADYITTASTVDPAVYSLVVVLAPIEAEKPVTVTEKLNGGSVETQITRGESYIVPDAAADTAEHKFAAWIVRYESGASLSLAPGASFKPYADCTVEPLWTEIIVVTANQPVPSGDSYAPNGYTYSGNLAEGDQIANVTLTISEDGGAVYSVPTDAVIEHNGKNVSARYELRYNTSEPYIPSPALTEITITANAPVFQDSAFVKNGYELTIGSLNDGDEIAEVTLDVVQQEDGSYVAVPSNAVIRNGENVTTEQYIINYQKSPAVVPPAPEKVELTITANSPVQQGEEYVKNGFVYDGTLNAGDEIADVQISVVKNEDGSYTAVPSNAVIRNGGTDTTESYNIHYQNSASVTPPAPEKTDITITANPPVLGSDGKTYEAAGYTLTSGKLKDGDSFAALEFDVKKTEDGSYISVPRDAVIKNGDTDNTANYNITYASSSPTVPAPADRIALTLRSKDRTAEYTGKPITADSYEITSGALAEGDTMTVSYDGGSTNVTSSPVSSGIASVVIKDSAGNDVTTSKYAVTLDNANAGKVTVTKHTITITAISGTVETDGTKTIVASECKTSNGSFTNGYNASGLLSGHSLRGSFVRGSGKETFVTSIDKDAVQIVDESNADVTANYDIHTVDGKLTIKVTAKTNVPVAVIAKDVTLNYDGTAHKIDASNCSVSGLLDNDVATVTLQLKQGETTMAEATNAGTYTIVPVVTIKTKDGAAVASDKYKITATNGTLTIKPFNLTLEAVSASKAYDGTALRNGEVKATQLVSGHKFRSGDGVKFTVTDSNGNLVTNGVTKVGVYTKKVTEVHIVDANGNEVTSNYNIIKVDGKLEITQSNQSKNDNGGGSKSGRGVQTGDSNDDIYVIILIVASVLLIGSIFAYIIMANKKKRMAEPGPAYGEEYYEPDESGEDWQARDLKPSGSKNEAWRRPDDTENWEK